MGNFLHDNLISIIFGITTLITSLIALHYRRLEHRRDVEEIIETGQRVALFLSRPAMIKYLLSMYDRAEAGDIIWAQCVRCADLSSHVHHKILQAAGKHVHYKMIINRHAPARDAFHTLFAPLQQADIIDASDNRLSLQGLSHKEVVIAVPDVEHYTAVLIRDEQVVQIFKAWFDNRFEQHQQASQKNVA